MIVRQLMKSKIVTLRKDDTINVALDTMKENKIRHIPIVNEDDGLVGLITERDIRDASPSAFQLDLLEAFLSQPLERIMTTDIITGHPLDFAEELAAVLIQNKISCIPILQGEILVGLLTKTDLLHTFVKLTGADQPASHIEVKVPNIAGMLAEVSSVFRNRHVNISSVLVYPDANDKYKILVFRVQTMNVMSIINDLQANGYHVLCPNELENGHG